MALHAFRCAECGSSFEAVRSDAETCSQACRLRRHRARADARHLEALRAATRYGVGLAAAYVLAEHVDDLDPRDH